MLPTRLRHVRETLGLTRASFARRLRVTRNSVSRYELGHQVPPWRSSSGLRRSAGSAWTGCSPGEDTATPRRARPDEWLAAVAALRRLWMDPTQRAAVRVALEAWARGTSSALGTRRSRARVLGMEAMGTTDEGPAAPFPGVYPIRYTRGLCWVPLRDHLAPYGLQPRGVNRAFPGVSDPIGSPIV
jgi:transcriptional regulator with XRE-family HTH domain